MEHYLITNAFYNHKMLFKNLFFLVFKPAKQISKEIFRESRGGECCTGVKWKGLTEYRRTSVDTDIPCVPSWGSVATWV